MKLIGRSQPTLWAALFFAYLSTVDCAGILCYFCTVAPKPGAKLTEGQICSRFETTTYFQVWCPNSTLCMKRSIHHRLVNRTLVLTSVERGCAPQLRELHEYDHDKKEWNKRQEVIAGAYRETCFTGEDRGGPGGPANYCYCPYHLCNGCFSPKNTYILTVILTILLMWTR